ELCFAPRLVLAFPLRREQGLASAIATLTTAVFSSFLDERVRNQVQQTVQPSPTHSPILVCDRQDLNGYLLGRIRHTATRARAATLPPCQQFPLAGVRRTANPTADAPT